MILADTHVLVWLGQGNEKLPGEARDRLLGDGFCVSAVTAWEYTDLKSRGRLGEAVPLRSLLEAFAAPIIDFPAEAAAVASSLPHDHGDPVDRMLIGHAIAADAELATADAKIRRYPVRLLW